MSEQKAPQEGKAVMTPTQRDELLRRLRDPRNQFLFDPEASKEAWKLLHDAADAIELLTRPEAQGEQKLREALQEVEAELTELVIEAFKNDRDRTFDIYDAPDDAEACIVVTPKIYRKLREALLTRPEAQGETQPSDEGTPTETPLTDEAERAALDFLTSREGWAVGAIKMVAARSRERERELTSMTARYQAAHSELVRTNNDLSHCRAIANGLRKEPGELSIPEDVQEWMHHLDIHLTEHDLLHAGRALRAGWPPVRDFLKQITTPAPTETPLTDELCGPETKSGGDVQMLCRQLERTLHAKERELANANLASVPPQTLLDALIPKNFICGGKPVVLWVDVVDAVENLHLKRQLATLQSVSAAPQDAIALAESYPVKGGIIQTKESGWFDPPAAPQGKTDTPAAMDGFVRVQEAVKRVREAMAVMAPICSTGVLFGYRGVSLRCDDIRTLIAAAPQSGKKEDVS